MWPRSGCQVQSSLIATGPASCVLRPASSKTVLKRSHAIRPLSSPVP